MKSIRILEDQLTNMIAAGEVVERPASVVKELVENSIDAGSRSIEAQVEDGGLRLIKVTDDGRGMNAEDCELCFERHATSKIRRARDLFRIQTLGFRGEALPSIAAVSRMELISCAVEGEPATKISLEGGGDKRIETVARPRGTEVIVRDLFFNTPARLKYVKSIQTEVGHIADYMNRLALSYPEISFQLVSDGRTLLKTYGDGKLSHAIASVYGMSIAKEMLPIEAENYDFKINGYLCSPLVTRANRSYITLLINGRYVRHQGLTQAILRGYHTLLPIHRYPIAVLSIQMDPSLLDVNVHPAKLEVRFSKEQQLLAFVEDKTRDALRKQRFIPEPIRQTNRIPSEQTQLTIAETDSTDRYVSIGEKPIGKQPINRPASSSEAVESAPASKTVLVRTDSSQEPIPPSLEKGKEREELPVLYPLGQLHGTYVLAQSEDGLYIIDQHAAQERVWYDYFMEKLREEKLETQELLVPIALELSINEMKQIEEKIPLFEQVGIRLEPFGQHTFLIRSHPRWFPQGEEEAIIHEMADMIMRGESKIDTARLREKAAITMSCKAAIKANRHLNHLELEALLRDLRASASPYTCPHGRPIIVRFSTYEIEKMFKRVM